MADEENNEQQAPEEEAKVDEAPEEAPEPAAEPEAAAEEAPEEEAAEEEAAEEPPEEEATQEEEAAETPASEPAADAEPAEARSPKQLRKRARAQHSGEERPERTAEERAAERRAARKAKIASRSRYRAARRAKKGEPREGTPAADPVEGTKKLRQGIVTSSKADKTITVAVESARRHPSYEKIVRRSKSLQAHDPENEAGEGDTVRVIETRPMSKTKRWRLVEVIEKAK